MFRGRLLEFKRWLEKLKTISSWPESRPNMDIFRAWVSLAASEVFSGDQDPRASFGRDSSGRKARCPSVGGVEVLTVANLSRMSWLVHGFSTRQGGVSSAYGGRALNLGLTREDTPENIARNRERFIGKLGALDTKGRPWPVITVNQIHSAIIHRVDQELSSHCGATGWSPARPASCSASRLPTACPCSLPTPSTAP